MSFKIKRNKVIPEGKKRHDIEYQASLLMSFHFDPEEFMHKEETCSACADYIQGHCEGKNLVGRQCFECMIEKVKSGQIVIGCS